jgi:hypothetical protein
MIYVIDTLVHLHNREHEIDPRSDVGKPHISIYTLTEGRSGSDQMLGNGIYVSMDINQLLADEVKWTFPRTAVWQVVTSMLIGHTWMTKKILKWLVILVSNMLSENISLFNPDQSFPIQINIFPFSSLATLNKKEFIVDGHGTSAYREDAYITLVTASAYCFSQI